MNDVGEKKSFARKPQNWNTKPLIDGVKSPFGRKLPARCRLTGVPVWPPTPVSPGTNAFIVTLEPSWSLKMLTQFEPHATVSFGWCVAADATPALAPK